MPSNEHRMPHEPVEQEPAAALGYDVQYVNNPFPGAVNPADKDGDDEGKPKPKARRRSRKPKTDDPAPFEVDTNAAIRDSGDK